MNFIQIRIRICAVIAHHQIGNDRGILRLNAEDIIALNSDAVPHLDHEKGNGIFFLELAQIGHRNRRRRNRHLAPQEDGEGCCRTAHRNVSDFSKCIALEIGDTGLIIAGRRIGRGCSIIGRCIVVAGAAIQEGINLLLRDHVITHSRRHPLPL